MRGTWRRVHGGIMYHAYWRGVSSALGGRDDLAALGDAASGATPPDHRVLEIDLAGDLDAVRSQIDTVRPDLLRLRFGALPLGEVRASPGREPFRGSHLTSLPAELARALIATRALAELRSHAPASPSSAHG